ncbi:hypothetical protein DEO72_LG2g2988 [Vigna unguiculata]|uniref:Gnk2-homologous domain-containing protein n=1 Tax=Vigna unguiculata TaxID=3917 RepID=A0A4D6L2D5_VIGUN|nr:hypothetical protein DEO72_LG2g2988 [Vigna unguiculata]
MALASYGFVCLSFLSFATADTDYRNLTDLVDYVYLNCSKDTIAGTVFQSNLKTLLWILSNNATTETGFNKTTVKYVTESTALNDEQCTQDLSSDDCVGCLTDINGRILYPSCNIRFQLFPFYRAHADPPQRPAPSSLQEKQKGQSRTTIFIIVPTIILLTLSLCYYLINYYLTKRKRRKNVKTILREQFGHESVALEPLQFKLTLIEAATNNFSHENRIGRGGFGEVYKVALLVEFFIYMNILHSKSYIEILSLIKGVHSMSPEHNVFSFGVMVLEIITGKKNASSYESNRIACGLLNCLEAME